MGNYGLKYKIIGSYVLLLSIGMLLTNIVVVMLWQREVLDYQVESGLVILKALALNSPETLQKISPTIPSLAGRNCLSSAYLYNNITYTSLKGEQSARLKDEVRRVTASSSPTVKYYGRTWSVFSFAHKYVILAYPIRTDFPSPAAIGIVLDLKPIYDQIFQKHKIIVIYMFFNVLILSVVGLFRMIEYIVKPLGKLVDISESYSGSETAFFSTEKEGYEFQKLAASLNAMLNRIEADREKQSSTVLSLEIANRQLRKTQNEVVIADKMAALGVLSAGLAHEIGNPLGIVQGYLELLRHDSLSTEDRNQFVGRAIWELDKIDSLIRQMLTFSKTTGSKGEVVNVSKLLEDLDSMLTVHRDMRTISYIQSIDIDSHAQIRGGTGVLQVLLNCSLNAVDALKQKENEAKKWIKLSCHYETDKDNILMLKICIEDNGIGINEDQLPLIFNPFYTTKEPGKGTGLGLSVSYSLIKAIGGRIWAEGKPGQGAMFHLLLPLYVNSQIEKNIADHGG